MKVLIPAILFSMAMPRGKIYTKEYFNMGQLKAGGWLNGNAKTDYWFFYYKNEGKKEEGFYTVNQRNKYWKFYKVDEKKQMEGRFRSDSAYGWWVFYGNDKVEKKVEYSEGKKKWVLPLLYQRRYFKSGEI